MIVTLRVSAGPHAGHDYVFDRHDTFSVGRSTQADFPAPEDGFLSRNHFLVEFNPPDCLLRDLGSTNGTKVNGVRVDTVRLKDGDVITAGGSAFVVCVEDTTIGGTPRIRCTDCGTAAPPATSVASLPGDLTFEWLCDGCIAHRRRFPTPPEGYRIERRIGGGGMGEVFLAWRRADNAPFAIKMMIPTVAASRHAKERFLREQEVMKDLVHPNIVAFIDMFEIDGQFQLIMEYVDGKEANEWRATQTVPLDYGRGARIGVQLLAALDHAHSKGYVHRDIKPSNLLVGGPPHRPKVKLSDFGLAKSFRDDAGFVGLTHQGDIGGSVAFVSPDHIRDFRQVKEPADIYSAGATLYWLLTGQYPYLNFNPNRADAYNIILEHPPIPLRAYRPDIPEALDRVLRKAMEKQPRDRWRSAAAMARGAEAVRRRPKLIDRALVAASALCYCDPMDDATRPGGRRILARLGTVAIIGVGLIGGSIGRALRVRDLAATVIGVGRDEAALGEAARLGIIDAATTSLARGVAEADVAVVCTPVTRIAEDVLAAAAAGPPGLLITDAGSTKLAIAEAVDRVETAADRFVGAHPIAGSERKGFAHADARLFDGRTCVLTAGGSTSVGLLGRAIAFWESIGCRVVLMSPEAHDEALATTSHLPHAVASALAASTPRGWVDLAAGAYRDGTRVASSDADLWAGIFLQNTHPLLLALDAFEGRLALLKDALRAGDARRVSSWWSEGRAGRAAFDARWS